MNVDGMQSRFVTVNEREIHYTEWGATTAGAAAKPVLIMWHGLTRCGRDFDIPAKHLSAKYRVLCPDTIGRGLSQWAVEHEEYCIPNYVKLAGEFVNATCGRDAVVDWFGLSMGGIIGWHACSKGGPLEGRIRKLVLDDIAPELDPEALAFIAKYTSVQPVFNRMSELEDYFRGIYEVSFGPQPEGWFRNITQYTARRLPDGRVTPHYDPRCTQMVSNTKTSVSTSSDVWAEFDACTAESILAVRGAKSSLLTEEIHKKMATRGLNVQLATIPDAGHAPTFNTPEELALADSFFGP